MHRKAKIEDAIRRLQDNYDSEIDKSKELEEEEWTALDARQIKEWREFQASQRDGVYGSFDLLRMKDQYGG
jgi:hypothetical protein